MNLFRSAVLPLAAAAWCGCASSAFSQSNFYRGLWVGDVTLGAVSEVTTPLDANNIPRSPDPNVTTPTSDTASLRLIIHVDATGHASLLKYVAILAKKDGVQGTESDLALVTNERLYGQFPAQAAMRISSAAFDFGDAKATAAVNQIVDRASSAAATAAAAPGATIATVQAAVLAAINPLVAPSDTTARFSAFLQASLNADQVKAISHGGSTTAALAAANALRDGSFYKDTRGLEMLQAIIDGLAANASATPAQKEQLALNIAASFAETADAYERYLSGEIFGNMITTASKVAAEIAATLPLKPISTITTGDAGASVVMQSTAHGLSSGDEIAIIGAPISRYNGLHVITRVDANSFKFSTPFVAGGAVGNYSGSTFVSPLVVVSPGHGLTGDTPISIRGAQGGYNGSYTATPLGPDSFSIPVTFAGDPSTRGSWAARSGGITGYTATADGSSGIKITSPAHGLNNGQTIEIFGSSTPSYNGQKTVTRIDENSFSINQAFAGVPTEKGSWDIPFGITHYSPPAITPTLVTAPNHGLQNGDRIVISGSGYALYNVEHPVKVVDANSFSIPVVFNSSVGVPAAKGTWQASGGGSWRKVAPIRTAFLSNPTIATAQTEASRIRVAAYNDTRAVDATNLVLESILLSAATNEAPLTDEVANVAAKAARDTITLSVKRYSSATLIPSEDYDAFVRSSTYSGSAATAALAAATAAMTEKQNLISTPASIADKAKASVITALTPVYAEASRTLLTSLPMTGTFSIGSSNLGVKIDLPANHPTNPFRHRRHPDHTVGFDIQRLISLDFAAAEAGGLSRGGYGVDRISGVYHEEIFGLHKPLGPNKDIGLKVQGTFRLNRISLIDTLNGK